MNQLDASLFDSYDPNHQKVFQLISPDWTGQRRRRKMVKELNTDRGGDLEVEDDSPYEPQRKLGISVCDVIIPDVHQLDLGLAEINKITGFVRNFTDMTLNVVVF